MVTSIATHLGLFAVANFQLFLLALFEFSFLVHFHDFCGKQQMKGAK